MSAMGVHTALSGNAAAVVSLLNSRAHARIRDKLDVPESAAIVLRPFGEQHGTPSVVRLEFVRAIRNDLLDLVAANDAEAATRAWASFSGRVASITFQQDFSSPGEVLLHQITGDPVVGRITQAVGTLIAEGNWSRLRSCANGECQEIFYDTTRSRTRRWHSYETCGNRTNVAAYRSRERR